MRTYAPALGLLDVPNARSSHSQPIPRGGGASIVITVTAIAMVLIVAGAISARTFIVPLLGALAVAAVGFADDRYDLSARIRICVHILAAISVVLWQGDLPAQPIGPAYVELGWMGTLVVIVAAVWMLNLFNFMDGIDGIAAMEGTFIFGAGAALVALAGGPPGLAIFFLGVALANLGFLRWNWPPARIFLGDVGSGYMGYLVAVAAVIAAKLSVVPLWTWVLLSSVFVGDATVTLLRRLFRGERLYSAHRMHAYQHLARRWHSHAKVTAGYLFINVGLIFPLACLSVLRPSLSAPLTLGALVFTSGLALFCGAGRRDSDSARE